jgi:hypothetical protein
MTARGGRTTTLHPMAADEPRGTPRRAPTDVEAGASAPPTPWQTMVSSVRRAIGGPTRTPTSPDSAPSEETPPGTDASPPPDRRPRPARPSTGAPASGGGPAGRQRPGTRPADRSRAAAAPRRPDGPTPAAGDDPSPWERFRRRRRARTRVRKVHRIVRHVDAWSVLKISVLFYLAVCLIVMVAGVLLWNVARSSGTIEQTEDFITEMFALGECPDENGEGDGTGEGGADADDDPVEQVTPFGEDGDGEGTPATERDCPDEELVGTYRLDGERIFNGFVLGGLILVVAAAAFNVVLVLLFNLISDLTGGVRLTVLEEPTATPARPPAGAKRPARRPPDQVAATRARP